MFIRIKNAQKAKHEVVQIPYSKFKHEILKILLKEKWIRDIERKGKKVRKFLEIHLNSEKDQHFISQVRLISKPSRRLYTSYKNLPASTHSGVVIMSTPRGILSTKESRKQKVGGEIIAEVW